jgi:hypothetical protein
VVLKAGGDFENKTLDMKLPKKQGGESECCFVPERSEWDGHNNEKKMEEHNLCSSFWGNYANRLFQWGHV